MFRTTIRTALGVALALGVVAAPAHADLSSAVDPSWVTNGEVKAAARIGTDVYVGGTFDYVGPFTGNGVVLDTANGTRQSGWPTVEGGQVLAAVPDGSGGWFIGGDFDKVGGQSRLNVAHVRSDKTIDSAWNPGTNNVVRAMVVSGGYLYIGGDFTTVAGITGYTRLAALSVTTGVPRNDWTPTASAAVRAMAMATVGGTSYVVIAGSFTTVNSVSHRRLARVRANDGASDGGWLPGILDDNVNALAIAGSAVYVGGSFDEFDDPNSSTNLERHGLGSFDLSTGEPDDLDRRRRRRLRQRAGARRVAALRRRRLHDDRRHERRGPRGDRSVERRGRRDVDAGPAGLPRLPERLRAGGAGAQPRRRRIVHQHRRRGARRPRDRRPSERRRRHHRLRAERHARREHRGPRGRRGRQRPLRRRRLPQRRRARPRLPGGVRLGRHRHRLEPRRGRPRRGARLPRRDALRRRLVRDDRRPGTRELGRARHERQPAPVRRSGRERGGLQHGGRRRGRGARRRRRVHDRRGCGAPAPGRDRPRQWPREDLGTVGGRRGDRDRADVDQGRTSAATSRPWAYRRGQTSPPFGGTRAPSRAGTRSRTAASPPSR